MNDLRRYIRLLIEQVDRPQVIFMAGGPGSGKSTVIRSLGLAERMEIVNPDDAYEAALKMEGIPMDRQQLLDEYMPIKERYLAAVDANNQAEVEALEPEYTRLRGLLSRNMKLFTSARKKAAERQQMLADAGTDFLVDGTGGNYRQITNLATKLRESGYEVGMIFIDVPMEVSVERDRRRGEMGGRRLGRRTVERSWNSVNRNKEPYQQFFGDSFFYVDATEENFRQSIVDISGPVGSFLR